MSFLPCSASVFALAGFVLVSGCATQRPLPSPPLSAAANAESFNARSLRDEGLRGFLADNLGAAPETPWDFETLSWVAFYYHPSFELARAQWATGSR